MRLSDKEKTILRSTVEKFDPNSKVYLYGSRTNDALKGGDIDLLVLSETLTFSDKISILVEIKQILGEQKIDLLIANQEKQASNPFVIEVMKTSVQL
ncbi:nucleotidyltransferase domain-containing protein [Bdellovibrionota bacterium FG-2]